MLLEAAKFCLAAWLFVVSYLFCLVWCAGLQPLVPELGWGIWSAATTLGIVGTVAGGYFMNQWLPTGQLQEPSDE